MEDDIEIYVDENGDTQFVYSDELASVFEGEATETRRASMVEPCGTGWTADLAPVGGPVLGPFPTRAAALGAEVEYLRREMASRTLRVR